MITIINKKQRLVIFLGLILIICCGLVWKINTTPFDYAKLKPNAQNTTKFTDLAQRTTAYSREQLTALGVVGEQPEIQNTCYQYPRPNNESYSLWCGSSVTKVIAIQPDMQHIVDFLKRLDPVMATQRLAVSIPAGTNTTVDAIVYEASTAGSYDDPTCTIAILHYPIGNSPQVVKDPAHVKYQFSCRAPSSGSVPGYRYIDNKNHIYTSTGPLIVQ